MSEKATDRDERRAKQISDMQALKALLTARGPMPCSEAARILGWSPGRPEGVRGLFTMYFVTYRGPGNKGKGMNMIDIHPHLRRRTA